MEPRMRSYLSSSARHHDAWTSSGSAPHSAHRPVDSVDDRFRLRASSKRRWRPFFTRTPCHTRSAPRVPPPRPDRTGHLDRRASVVAAGDRPPWPRSRERLRASWAVPDRSPRPRRGRSTWPVAGSDSLPRAAASTLTAVPGFDPHEMVARFRAAGRGRADPRHAADRGARTPALPRAGPAGLHRLRHDRRRRGRAGRRHPHPAHRPAAAEARRTAPRTTPPCQAPGRPDVGRLLQPP